MMIPGLRMLASGLVLAVAPAVVAPAPQSDSGYSLPRVAETSASRGNASPPSVAAIHPATDSVASIEILNPAAGRWRLVLRSGQTESVLSEVPKDEAEYVVSGPFLASFPVGPSSGLEAFVWQYVVGSGLRYEDYRTTYLVLCLLDRGHPIGSCQTQKVAETSIHKEVHSQPEDVWLYWSADADRPTRATESDVRLLVRDGDGDGFDDLVIWRRTCGALAIADSAARERDPKTFEGKVECNLDFVLERDERLWMRFDPTHRTFEAPTLNDKLPVPNRDLWNRLPNVGHLSVR